MQGLFAVFAETQQMVDLESFEQAEWSVFEAFNIVQKGTQYAFDNKYGQFIRNSTTKLLSLVMIDVLNGSFNLDKTYQLQTSDCVFAPKKAFELTPRMFGAFS